MNWFRNQSQSLVLLSLVLAVGSISAATPTRESPASSTLVIAGPQEPGTRLIVTGRILQHDGRAPARGSRVGVYHTDASGVYGVHPTRSSFPPARDARLSGWVTTDTAGRFEIRTIRPAPYPQGRTPAHIHFIVGGNGSYELRFADDPLRGWMYAEGNEVQVRPVRTDSAGVQHVTAEWRLPR